ncbi:hypothetical protein GCM10011390_01880 [Aureimonas endophytica]|uniref:Carrier domain-containing protein n=1 Tax=Aureimonas endophytica TaxID=2027858 RepID=A0A916ZBN3_9HYPH|nr:acyl carrier protein [Aureimonas endophytica]GGD86869.1 hypothetical protein GCM10011390_01880 [Aureimonas endophytica]
MEQSDDLLIGGCDADESSAADGLNERVVAIVAEVLGRPRGEFGLETRAADVEGWDSFAHVRIVLAIDSAFRVKLSMEAIEKADGIAGLVEAVEEACATR